ncbi:hypothetical protein GGR27_001141 [Lewinella antarctica]|uniref:Secretion system C-terminal sorting domain-containing protein n=1 Tax=Neolewinella antarctica TaxID=442734 RepID=A0ABX0X8Y7_9BACT|nr:hypothetical protein [Neolewinella antarctica]
MDNFAVTVTPNPTNTGNVSVKVENDKLISYTIISMTGQELYSTMVDFPEEEITLDTKQLSTGLYILRTNLESGNTAVNKIIVKN